MKFPIILFSILLYGLTVFGQSEPVSGLFFSSHEVNQDKRTSLILSPREPLKFPQGFSLEFDANFRKGDGYYGYIFRIIGDGNTNIDLISNSETTPNFSLVLKDRVLITYKWADIPNATCDQWLKVRAEIDVKKTKLAISFNGIRQEINVPEIAQFKYFDVVFGACKNNRFPSTDVSPMSLKNIRIYDHNLKLIRDWGLSKHGQDIVYDEISNSEAIVNNPVWVIDNHKKWRKINDFHLPALLGIANDEERGRIFLVGNKAVYVLSMDTRMIDTIQFAGGAPYPGLLSKQIIYNKFSDELWSYNFSINQINKFSFRTKRWSVEQSNEIESIFAHHNKLISPLDNSLVTLFGYGHYTYKSKVNHFNSKSQQWEQIDRSSQIEPRYLSSTGFVDDKHVLVFGGRGSKTGRQELSPKFYYDLYAFDLTDFSFKKRWTLPTPSSPFVPCESLIFNEQSKSFYTLVFNSGQFQTYLRLAQFSVEKPEVQFYEDSIPFNFLDIESDAQLFFNKQKTELLALTAHNADVSLYSIAFPPLMLKNIIQDSHFGGRFNFVLGFFALLLLLTGTGAYFVIRRRRIKPANVLHQKFDYLGINPIPVIEQKVISSFIFVGGFQIYTGKGVDITTAFSPTLKQLFLFVLLHSVKNGKGVTSIKLDEVLWPDKVGDSARNNRNVNISKLRSILHEIGDVDITNENSYWKIKIGDSISCDYIEILSLLRKSKAKPLALADINKLLAQLSYGEFLPNLHNEWIDGFKSEFANEIIEGLSSLFYSKEITGNFSLRYQLAESILIYDPFNDEAFAMKCSVLYHLGKKGIAKNYYDTFCHEYRLALGIAYTIPFNDVIK